jgi:hypothetical protein
MESSFPLRDDDFLCMCDIVSSNYQKKTVIAMQGQDSPVIEIVGNPV